MNAATAIKRSMTTQADPAGRHRIDAETLDRMQLAQFRHDETYHREISRLTVKARLTHMALHFAKYAGYLADAPTDERVRRTITDMFVIGVSTLNVLNVRIHPLLGGAVAPSDTSVESVTREVTIQAGRMSSACERLDHLEDFPYRTTLQGGALAIVSLALAAASARGWDMSELVSERLRPVKEKSIFHGKI